MGICPWLKEHRQTASLRLGVAAAPDGGLPFGAVCLAMAMLEFGLSKEPVRM